MNAPILAKIQSADNLPSLPTVAMQVLQMTQADDVSVAQIAKVVQQDPALTAKILKMVNSALFGMPRKIASLQQAMVVLGLRTVKVMALSFSLVDTMRDTGGGGFDYEAFWRRSLTTAAAARLIGQAVARRSAEEAFVAGLLSDLGMVAAWRCAQELYQPVLETAYQQQRPLPEVETEQLGVSHAGLGLHLLQQWKLPQNLCDAVGAHHGEGIDGLEGPGGELAKIIYAAATVSGLFCQDLPLADLEEVKKLCQAQVGVQGPALENVLEALDHHVKEAASLLSLDIGQTVNYAQLQAEAATRLAHLSMQAEVDRAESRLREQTARLEADRLQEERKAILETASTDSLTKIANRAAFDTRLEEELDKAQETGQPLSLILMDVDHFKKFNDTHGHQAGDQVLRIVAACMKVVAQHDGFVARYGGEEFAVIVPGRSPQQVQSLAEKVRQTIQSKPLVHDGQELRITASLGVSFLNHGEPTLPEDLIGVADRNLYRAKDSGRNRVQMPDVSVGATA